MSLSNSSFSLGSILRWLDDNILFLLASFLLVFIPLWPKIPLFSPIEQYIVRVRFEDILILITGMIWGVQWLRGKIQWRNAMTWLIIGYGVVGLLSVLSAMFVIHTVPLQPLHVGKTVLHYFRYLEYFFLFFAWFSAIKTRKQVMIALSLFAASVLAISIYGYGQKYWYWPVYSTMNREFSKGIRLYLTEHARVQSTFAGHYDLAAYLVITLPIIVALAFSVERKWLKVLLHLVHIAGMWLMVVSASRTSFVAYVISLSAAVGFLALRQQTWWKRFTWGSTRLFAMGVIVSLMMVFYGEAMYERFLQVLQAYPQVSDTYHYYNGRRKFIVTYYVPAILGLQAWPQAAKPQNGISTEQLDVQIANGILPSDVRPVSDKPSDVYVDVPIIVPVATQSASGAAIIEYQEQERVFSDCSKRRGLSLCIRLETLWPRALAGFMRNPLLGSGYATLNKESVDQFTEAESTDNNFLRTLGETGALGFITFYGCVLIVMGYAARQFFSADKLKAAVGIGLFAGTIGLLLNAVYIDVFAASKVALTYWGLAGLLIAFASLDSVQTNPRTLSLSNTSPMASSTSDFAARLAQAGSVVTPQPRPVTNVKPIATPTKNKKNKLKKRRR